MKAKSIIPVLILALSTACSQGSSDNSSSDNNSTEFGSSKNNGTTSTNNVVVSDWPPSEALIATDLIGRKLTEGTENGYQSKDWTFNIESGNISDLKVSEVLTHTDSKYLALVDMKLSKGGNYYYQTKARVNYVKSPEDNTPVLDYVTSLGMTVVSDGEYDDDIEHSIEGSFLELRNKCDVSLTVGGKILEYNSGWRHFCIVVPAQSSRTVSPSHWSALDYRIDFVIRDY